MPQLAAHFAKVMSANQLVVHNLRPSWNARVMGFYTAFWIALLDWHMTCRHYDAHLDEWQSFQPHIHEYFRSGSGAQPTTVEQRDFLNRWGNLNSELKYDIRCFYIFANMARETFTEVIKETQKEHGRSSKIFTKYKSRFKSDDLWFHLNVEIYRDKFIVHPRSITTPAGIIADRRGARLSGITAISEPDEKLLLEIESDTKETLPDLPVPPLLKYVHLCENLEAIPAKHLKRFIEMIQRVGLESGNLDAITARLCEIYANLIEFFVECNNVEKRKTTA